MMRLIRHAPHWLVLVTVAGALRLVNLGYEALWYDESFTAWLAQRLSFQDMIRATAGDVHPPLWYIISWLNAQVLGRSEFALRLPAAIFGVGAVLLVWRVALSVGMQRRVAFVAGLLAAIMPVALYYSQDARMYPLLTVFVLGALLAIIQRQWWLYLLCSVGAIYTQNIGIIYVAALTGAGWLLSQRSVKFLVAGAGVAVAWLPWLPVFLAQSADVRDGFWLEPLSLQAAIAPVFASTMGQRITGPVIQAIYIAVTGLTGVSVLSGRRWLLRRPGLLYLSVTFGAPALLALVSFVWRNVYLQRALLPSSHLIMILWAYGLMSISPPNRRIARLIVVPCLVLGLISHYAPRRAREDYREWVRPLLSRWQDGDVIFHTAVHTAILFGYYLPDQPAVLRSYASDLNQALTEETKIAMGFQQGTFEDLTRAGYRHVWLMEALNPMSRADEYAEVTRLRSLARERIAYDANEMAEIGIYLIDLEELNVTAGRQRDQLVSD